MQDTYRWLTLSSCFWKMKSLTLIIRFLMNLFNDRRSPSMNLRNVMTSMFSWLAIKTFTLFSQFVYEFLSAIHLTLFLHQHRIRYLLFLYICNWSMLWWAFWNFNFSNRLWKFSVYLFLYLIFILMTFLRYFWGIGVVSFNFQFDVFFLLIQRNSILFKGFIYS